MGVPAKTEENKNKYKALGKKRRHTACKCIVAVISVGWWASGLQWGQLPFFAA
jgi:hypothetical protein